MTSVGNRQEILDSSPGGVTEGEGRAEATREGRRMKWQPYPGYRPSGVEWLGEVPEHWATKRLKYSAQLINEKVEGRDTDLPYIGLEHIESWTGKRIVTAEPSNSEGQSNHIRIGDVLFGKLRPYLAKVLRASEEGICTGELLVLKPNCVVQDFLFYYMLSKDFISIVDSSTYGAKMPRASWEFIGNLPTLVPSQNEQRAIAAFLDRETGRIDALMEKKQRQVELLQEKRAALISHAVTKGLDPTGPMKDSGVEWLGHIPAHWVVFSLKRLAYRIQTGSTPPTSEVHYYEDGEVPWFGPGSFGVDLVLVEPVKMLSPIAVKDGVARIFESGSTMIVTIGATIGKVGYIEFPASSNQQITGVTFRPSRVIAKFGAYQMKRLEPVLRGIAPSSTLPILDQQKVGYLPFVLPPIDEQTDIANFLDQETTKIDGLIAKIQESLDRLKEYRTALISAAVTGRIDVREEAA